jgi:purine-binding chemotaxis protein CheW
MLARQDIRDIRPEDRPAAAGAGRHYVGFTVGAVDYAVAAEVVRLLLPVDAPLPGVLRALDRAVGLVDLRERFATGGAGRAGLALVAETDGHAAALVVDQVRGLIELADGDVSPLPAVYRGVERDWFEGMARRGDRVLVVARAGALLRGGPGREPIAALAERRGPA